MSPFSHEHLFGPGMDPISWISDDFIAYKLFGIPSLKYYLRLQNEQTIFYLFQLRKQQKTFKNSMNLLIALKLAVISPGLIQLDH